MLKRHCLRERATLSVGAVHSIIKTNASAKRRQATPGDARRRKATRRGSARASGWRLLKTPSVFFLAVIGLLRTFISATACRCPDRPARTGSACLADLTLSVSVTSLLTLTCARHGQDSRYSEGCSTCLWTLFGPPLDHPWTACGLPLDHLWTAFRPSLDHLWTAFGPPVDCL